MKFFDPKGILFGPGVGRVVSKLPGGKIAQDPLNLIPKRPVQTEYVYGSGDPASRRAQGYRSGLMGISRLTG